MDISVKELQDFGNAMIDECRDNVLSLIKENIYEIMESSPRDNLRDKDNYALYNLGWKDACDRILHLISIVPDKQNIK